jgi:hypothetical protein
MNTEIINGDLRNQEAHLETLEQVEGGKGH